MKYKYLLFDADGTLFDFDAAEAVAFTATLEHYGRTCSDSELELYHNINQELWDSMAFGKITREELVIERFRIFFAERAIKNIDPSEFNELYRSNLSLGNKLFDGAEALCKKLSETHVLALVTNGVAATQQKRIGSSPVKKYFSEIFISGEMGCQKPEKKFFDTVFEKMNITDPSTALVIGDSLVSDIAGGINSGIDTCFYNPSKKINDSGFEPTYEISSYDDLFDIV